MQEIYNCIPMTNRKLNDTINNSRQTNYLNLQLMSQNGMLKVWRINERNTKNNKKKEKNITRKYLETISY